MHGTKVVFQLFPVFIASISLKTQYTEASRYSKPTTNWDGYYAGNIKDLQTIIDYNTDPATAPIALGYGSNNNQIAVARILKAYVLWFLTDTYGDILITAF